MNVLEKHWSNANQEEETAYFLHCGQIHSSDLTSVRTHVFYSKCYASAFTTYVISHLSRPNENERRSVPSCVIGCNIQSRYVTSYSWEVRSSFLFFAFRSIHFSRSPTNFILHSLQWIILIRQFYINDVYEELIVIDCWFNWAWKKKNRY